MALVLVLSACPAGIERPGRVVTPDAVGIIEDLQTSEDGATTTVRLKGGGEVALRVDDLEAYGTLNVGSLLVSGQLDDARWHMSLVPSDEVPTDCYVLAAGPFDDGSHVVFPAGGPRGAYGIRLPKSEGFVADEPEARTQRYGHAESPTFFCVNSVGEVTGQEDQLRREPG